MKRKIKVCYVLSYMAPNYVRTASLVQSLKFLSNVELFEARNTRKGLIRYIETFVKFVKIRFKENPDIYIIGFRGHEIYWFLRIFALKKVFIFDEMMSPADSLLNERKSLGRVAGGLIDCVERGLLKNADYILTDTKLHKGFFHRNFGLDKDKIGVIPVGTDEQLFNLERYKDKERGENDNFIVFFYGTFLPLHGINIIVQAAKLVEEFPIEFILVGGRGKEEALKEFRKEMKEGQMRNIEHYEWLEFKKLPTYIKNADLCLGGPFGGTAQAKRVVTGKTYQFLAMGKPTVIGKIEEDFGFRDRKNCLLVEQRKPKELADAILWAYHNKGFLSEIGENGRKLYFKNFSNESNSHILKEILEKLA